MTPFQGVETSSTLVSRSIYFMNHDLLKQLSIFSKILHEIPLLTYVGNPILRQQTQKVEVDEGVDIGNRLQDVIKQYRSFTGYGRGIAAPQISLNKSVFVTYLDDKFQTFINPQIIERSKETNFYKELCMSSGILAADVERPEWIVMEWIDEEGKSHKEKVDGFLARLYQHEEAHLRGIVNLDEAAPQGIELVTFNPFEEKLRKVR